MCCLNHLYWVERHRLILQERPARGLARKRNPQSPNPRLNPVLHFVDAMFDVAFRAVSLEIVEEETGAALC
jgi:hypothetical protein